MSTITAYTDLKDQVVLYAPGCPDGVVEKAIREAGRAFCERSESWREWVEPIPITDWQAHYTLSHGYSATIKRVLTICVNGSRRPWRDVELLDSATLRFRRNVSRDDDNTVLKGGTPGETSVGTWQAITDASLTASIGGESVSVTALDFTGLSFVQIARKIETALRDAADNEEIRCEYWTDHFTIWTDRREVGYLTAGASGTDISGASYLNMLSGGGTLAPRLEAEVVLIPERNVDALPDSFLERWQRAIAAKARADLLIIPRKPWTNPETAAVQRFDYNDELTQALSENRRRHTGLKPTIKVQ
jgi:hypothetical protein